MKIGNVEKPVLINALYIGPIVTDCRREQNNAFVGVFSLNSAQIRLGLRPVIVGVCRLTV